MTGLQLVDDRAQADVELSGVIGGAEPFPAAMNAVGEPSIYNLACRSVRR